MSLERASQPVQAARLLICLDLRERATGQGPAARPGLRPAWQDRARDLLEHARGAGWPVAHLLAAHSPNEKARWRAIPGLSPTPAEPVFYADPNDGAPSAAFLKFAGHFGSAEVLLIGHASWPCRLDRLALSLSDRPITVAADAMPDAPRAAGLRLTAVRSLVRASPDLRLIPGGRKEPRP